MRQAAAVRRHIFFNSGENIQARAAWQWFNKYTADVPANKKLLRVNMDETNIRFYPGAVAGGLVVRRALSGEPVAPGRVPRIRRIEMGPGPCARKFVRASRQQAGAQVSES